MNPTKKQIANGTYKLVDVGWHKLCTGPAHEEPEYLPATSKYFYTHKSGPMKGELVSRCRLCSNWTKLKSPGSHHGYVEVEKVHQFYTEAVNRIGAAELNRRTGLSLGHLRAVVNKDQKYVKKAQLRRLMLELTSIKRKNEYAADLRSKWRTEQRNNNGLEVCKKCGTPKENITRGCDGCSDRWYARYRSGKITKAEWDRVKRDHFSDARKIMGKVFD